MFEAKILIECPALEALAAAIAKYNLPAPAPAQPPVFTPPAAPTAPAAPQAATVAPTYTLPPAYAPPAPQQPAPVNPTPAAAPVAPTAMPPTGAYSAAPAPAVPPMQAPTAPAPSITLEQVSRAGAELNRDNPAKMPELLGLLRQFGVPTTSDLRPDQLGPFATALRGLGAKI
jgi:hypothetical protein